MKAAKRNDKIDSIVCFAVHIYCIYIFHTMIYRYVSSTWKKADTFDYCIDGLERGTHHKQTELWWAQTAFSDNERVLALLGDSEVGVGCTVQ